MHRGKVIKLDGVPVHLDIKEYEDIKIKKLNREGHICSLLLDSDLQGENYKDTLEDIVYTTLFLNDRFTDSEVFYELTSGDKKMNYSEKFIKDVLKKEFVKYFKSNKE